MNEEYLWNKKGGDHEIEKLENALKSLRLQESTAPLLPVETAHEKRVSFRLFPFVVPAMACVTITLLTLSFWLKDSKNPSDEIAESIVLTQDRVQKTTETVNDAPTPAKIREETKGGEKPAVRRRFNKPPKARLANIRVNTVTAQTAKKANPADVLTKDEKHAYEQLMTALAITSSQFKLVKDKIQGIENQTADFEGGR